MPTLTDTNALKAEDGNDAWLRHEHYMQLALQQAQQAADIQEVPVGAVIVRHGHVIAAAHNLCQQLHDPTAHAEMIAITQAAESSAIGDSKIVRCMSRWNHVQCAAEPSCNPACRMWSMALQIPKEVPWNPCINFSRINVSITSPLWCGAFWERRAVRF